MPDSVCVPACCGGVSGMEGQLLEVNPLLATDPNLLLTEVRADPRPATQTAQLEGGGSTDFGVCLCVWSGLYRVKAAATWRSSSRASSGSRTARSSSAPRRTGNRARAVVRAQAGEARPRAWTWW